MESTETGRMVNSMLSEAIPIALDAIIVYDLVGSSDVGVPEITPESELIDNPDGSAGLTSQVLGASPTKLGVRDCISVPITRVTFDSPKDNKSGFSMVLQ